jgi:hypothetical protein
MLCPSRNLLMRLKVILTKGRNATETGFSGVAATESPSELPVALSFLPESGCEKLQIIIQAFSVTKGSGPVHQCGKYSLFVGRMVVVGV